MAGARPNRGPGDADLAQVGALFADRTRARILLALLGGTPHPASALADAAGVSRSLASSHLRKLVEGGLLTVEPRGRQRLYRLAGQPVAHALEAVMLLAPPARISSLREANRGESLRRARLCYDHVAGVLGVGVTEALVERDLLIAADGGFALSDDGADAMRDLGVDVAGLQRARRPLTRACLDWTERRNHLAGGLGAAMTARFVDRRWLESRPASRIVALTPAGRQGLRDWIGLDADALPAI